MNERVSVYRIDGGDILREVSPNWEAFARANGAGRTCRPGDVLGHSLWDFVHGAQTRHLYEAVFARTRSGAPCGPIPFRCDSPRQRRFLELTVSPLPDGGIEIESTILRTEPRDPVALIDGNVPRSNELIRICSMCKKIANAAGEWLEVEEGLAQLRPFEADEVPRLTHAVCPRCYETVMAELNAPGRPRGAAGGDGT